MTEELVMLPASFAQELMYLVHRSAPESTSYNVPRVRRLQGALDVNALQQALNALVERHEILRTTYTLHDEHPVQVIHNARAVPLEQLDMTGKSEADVERALRERMARAFDLGNDLLIRATLVRTAPTEHVLLLESHHIAFDGWSRDILFRELDAFYRQFAKGEAANLPALPIQYADFAIWQREQLSGDRLAALINHWRTALDGAPFSLDLPSDRQRGGRPSFDSASVLFRIEPATVDAAIALARANNATLYMVLLTAYMAVLQRWSGQSDVLVGSPVAGRARVETEGLIGYFANTIVQRGRFSNDPTFSELLNGVRESSLSAFDNQEIPFERLVQELAGTQDAARSPIFQVVFTQMGVQSGQAPTLGDVAMQTFAVDLGVTKFDLTLLFSQRPEGVELTLRYRTDLFSQQSAERFVSHLRAMVAGAVANPQAKVSSIDLLSNDERELLKKWNDTSVDEGVATTLVSAFEAQAARVPDRLAVVAADAKLTYAKLNASANQLARALVSAGVQAGQPVGLLLDRSAFAITGLLGIMKAGGAYMPLSVDAPAARIADQLRESGARVVVTAAAHAGLVPDGVGVIALDRDAALLASNDAQNLDTTINGDSLAYVLFTSGSTGTPKGVAVTHANAVHYARAVSRILGSVSAGKSGDGLAALDGLSFGLMSTLAADLGNTSLLPSLMAGGTLHVLEKAATTEPARFAEYLAANTIDIIKTTPNLLSALLTGRQDSDIAAVLPERWIVLGGEALRFDLARRLLGAGKPRVLNHYGPTETTVGVLTNEVTAESLVTAEESGAVTVPLGTPLANTHAYVVNSGLQQQPAGIPGELLLGGAGVTQGYLNRDDLTAERFVQFEGERVYRTGDRVRRLDDGRIEFLGRTDDQVKIRGYRVELGEIERTLREHPGVEQCVVLLADDQLVAYVVARQSGYAVSHSDRPTVENVSALAAARLPDYMVPGAIVFIERIPLTANGKVDRNALPQADASAKGAAAFVAPRTDTEIKLAQIWKDVLKKEQVGATDNFLELGGHSLFAIRVLGKISKTFGVRLPLRTLFEAPTVESLAAIIELEAKLAALESMSEEDAAKLLESMKTTGGT